MKAIEMQALNDVVEFKAVSDAEAKLLIDQFEKYTNNERLDLNQFEKYFDERHQTQLQLWYGCFKDGKCMALSVLKKIPEGFILLAEIQSVIKGYGKLLLEDVLSRSKNIWWCADPTGGESLADYYRQFDVEEHLIKMSKWTNTPEHAFFKVSDDKHRQQILSELAKADKTDKNYHAGKLKDKCKRETKMF